MRYLLLTLLALAGCGWTQRIEWGDATCWRWCDARRDRFAREWVHNAGRDVEGHCICDWETQR